MPNTVIPGTCPIHKIITDECRKNRGDGPAVRSAMFDIVDVIMTHMQFHAKQGKGFKFHLVMTVERPDPGAVSGPGSVEPRGVERKLCPIESHVSDCNCEGTGGSR